MQTTSPLVIGECWRGELRVKTCSLHACWKVAVTEAETILQKAGYSIDFSEHFRDWRTRGVDLLRPKGGKYPGISAEVDRSAEEQDEITDCSFHYFDGKKVFEEERRAVSRGAVHSVGG